MAGKWSKAPLGDLVQNFDSKRVPLSNRERAERHGNFPYYGATGVMDYVDGFLFEGLHLLVAEDGSVERPDGTPFVQLVDGQFWVNNHAHVLRAQTDEDTKFLYYALQTVPIRPFMSGSVQAKLSQANLNRIPIPYPMDEAERRAIAHILGTLDDKIELNRRMSETLEQMARAIFKAWFVDFDPVRAKMEGRWHRGESLPGLPAHLYDLFPARLVDSVLGEIPEGWRVRTLGDLAEVTSGKRPDQTFASPTPDANVPLWGGNGPMAYVRQPLFTEPILLTGRVGTLGSVFRISSPCWPSDNTLVVLPRKRLYMEYLYLCMKGFDFDSLNRGSTQPLLTQTDLKKQPLRVASGDMLNEFHKIANDLFARVDATTRESRTLAALRDALLPKLIRGEIRVKDAERFSKERGL
jgi:type I restriction enzyme S subunit